MADEIGSTKTQETVTSISSSGGLKPWIAVGSNTTALLIVGAIVWVAYHIGPSFHLNILVCLLGALIGWGVGMLASPFNKTESLRFISLGQAISAFVSGYLISKLDRFFEVALYKEGMLQDAAWARAGLFVASFLVMTILVFTNRMYWPTAKTSSLV